MSPDAGLLQADRAARQAALDTTRSFIVQAPAGSGKTELLIQRYLRLLAIVDEPEEIIAITFTRKAAAEMRLRVVAAMREAATGNLPPEAHLRITFEAAAVVLERDAAFGWDLLANPGRLRIQTLDSLNASIVRMLPVTAPGGGGALVADEHEMRRLYEEAAAATLDWLPAGDDNAHNARLVLEHLDGSTGSYIAELAAMLQTRDQWLPFTGSGRMTAGQAATLREHLESTLRYVIETRLRAALERFPRHLEDEVLSLMAYARERLVEEGRDDHPLCAGGELRNLPGTSCEALAAWLAIAEFLLTRSGSLRKQVNVTNGFPAGDDGQKATMKSLLESFASHTLFVGSLDAIRKLPPPHYSEAQWSILQALLGLLPVAAGELRRLCQQRGVTDYIEVAQAAGDALGTAEAPGDVALLLDYQVRHILVDEMQDTSSAQYRMLGALTGGWEADDGRTLFCVGDPMQSIYRFRNAEVAQFLLAVTNGIGGVALTPLVLRQNFRSGEHLVEWFNRVFPTVLPVADDPVSSAVSYAASVPAAHLAGTGTCRVHPVFGSGTTQEADCGAAVIRDLANRFPNQAIAVLVRGRTRLPPLLQRLRNAGIAYQAVDIDRITDLPEIIDLLALTRALAHDGDRVAWLGLLRAPWAGLDWSDLHKLVAGAGDTTVPELLADAARCEALSIHGQKAVQQLRQVLVRHRSPGRLSTLASRVEQAWFELGGPVVAGTQDAIDNVYLYLEALARIESCGTLADIADLMPQLDAIRATASSPANVQVMTMHKAKGLQFEHVVLYGLGRYSAGNRSAVLRWVDLPGADGSFDKLLAPIGRRDDVTRDPLHAFLGETAKEKDRHEDGRLLYVACTRAKQSLHLVGHTELDRDGNLRPPDTRSLLRLLWPAVEGDFQAAFEHGETTADSDDEEPFERPPLRRFASRWSLPGIGSVSGQAPVPEPLADELEVEYDWVGSGARLAGTVVHRWLQAMARGHPLCSEENRDEIRRTSRRWLREMGAGDATLDAIGDRVVDALAAVASDDKGRWLLAGSGASELPITGVVDGQLESVLIDRVRIDEQGVHWIVDYKTSTHEGGDLEGFIAAECRRYRPQLEKYAAIYTAYAGQPVRCALYFPLLKRFVELPVER